MNVLTNIKYESNTNISYNDLIKCGSMLKAKEAGLVRQEGKDYTVKDGDIMLFKFNV